MKTTNPRQTKYIHDSVTTGSRTLQTGTEWVRDVYIHGPYHQIMILIFILYFKPGFNSLHAG